MSLTHIAYARQIEEHIALKYGVNLRHFSLIYGSIKPDASILFGGKAPHYINLSLDMLCESANILINATDSLRELETRAFSRELGVIMHYVTDYFCRVHNDINGIKHSENFRHIIYEQNFQKNLEIYELEILREKNLYNEDEAIKRINNTSLKMYLIYKHNKYMKEAGKLFFYNNIEKKRQIDMQYSFCTSIEVASYIVNKCLKNFSMRDVVN